jgi:hypothetical protein
LSDGFASIAQRSRIRFSPIVDELVEIFTSPQHGAPVTG